jgi:hypothetical protein
LRSCQMPRTSWQFEQRTIRLSGIELATMSCCRSQCGHVTLSAESLVDILRFPPKCEVADIRIGSTESW